MPAKKKKNDAAAAKEIAAPQMETNPELDEMIAAEEAEKSATENTSPQTEMETAENTALAQEFSDDEAEKTSLPQTEMDSEKKDPDHAEFDINQEEKTADPQTDIETEEKTAIAAEDGVEGDKKTTIPQTDTEKEADEPEETPGRAHNPDNPQNQSESDTDEANKRADNTAAPRTRRRSIGISRTGSVLAIDDSITVETEADRARNDLLDLLESQKSKRILSGTLQGIERPEDNPKRSLAVIYHGDYKVIIPVEELIEPPQDYRGMQPEDVMHYLLQKRLGAEVDYIVKGVDPDAKLAVASRLDAMHAKRRQYYYGTDNDGNNFIYSGVCAEVRVVSVIRAGMFVELFGVETYIPLRELSYQRWMDATGHFQSGQRTIVKILDVDRSDRNNIRVSASVKQASENPYEKALRRYTVGNRYVGTVSMVDTNGVFVALDGGIDCLCSYPKRGRPPRGARVTVRILGVNHESNRVWGAITHIAAAR